jgi:hypothetical protein
MGTTPTLDEQAQELELTEQARRRAAATPLPGALADAFLTDAIQVTDNMFVRRVVASDWSILQWLDSPIYKMILEVQKDEAMRDAVTYTDEEEWEMCWQFTHSPKDCRALKAKGREVFRQTCIDEMGDTNPLVVTKKAVEAISKQILASFDTKIGFSSGEGDDSKKKTPVAETK